MHVCGMCNGRIMGRLKVLNLSGYACVLYVWEREERWSQCGLSAAI